MSLNAIRKLNANGIKCTALTKGLLPIELATLSEKNEYGITFISLDESYRERMEPGAAPYRERLAALKSLHDAGCKTWVSIEPYPTPNLIEQNLTELLDAVSFTDKVIFGRTNYNKEISSYGEGLSDQTVRGCHTTLRSALAKAVEEKLIIRNPVDGCRLPSAKPREMQVLTPEEMQRLLIQAKEDGCYELLLLELSTGLRRGEILALQWDDLNFNTGALRVERQVHRVKGELVISQPKTNSSNRTVILPSPVLKVLKEYRQTMTSRWMFPSPVMEDSPLDPASVRKRLQTVLERAGCKKVRFHDLRHTFATTALEHGMDTKTLSTIIGHVSTSTTLNIYAHVTDEMRRTAAVKIDRGISKTEPQKTTDSAAPRKPAPSTFQPYKGQRRKPGTGCVSQVNDKLWEGRYSPIWPDGKKHPRNVYAHSKEECERLLAEMIQEVKTEIAAEKERLNLSKKAG